jgi:hypothetical protein
LGFVGQITNPSPEAANSYIYTVYRLQEAVGAENVHHIPVYGQFRPIKSRVDMLNEALGLYKPQTKKAVQQIVETVGENRENLYSDQKLILVGSSAGGTIAIEALDELEKRGIFVDQIILRGSFVREYRLNNVGQIDYIAPDSPEDALWWNPWWSDKWNYSRDVNPFDSVSVQQHIVDGFTYHSPADIPDTSQRRLVREQIGNLIVDLLDW